MRQLSPTSARLYAWLAALMLLAQPLLHTPCVRAIEHQRRGAAAGPTETESSHCCCKHGTASSCEKPTDESKRLATADGSYVTTDSHTDGCDPCPISCSCLTGELPVFTAGIHEARSFMPQDVLTTARLEVTHDQRSACESIAGTDPPRLVSSALRICASLCRFTT